MYEVGATTNPSETIVKEVDNLGGVSGCCISEMVLDVAMAVFFGIEVRSIGRKILLDDLRMLAQKSLG